MPDDFETDHIRQRLLDAAVAKLAANCPLFAGVWLGPRPPLTKAEMPGCVVFQAAEQASYETGYDRNQKRFLDFEVLVATAMTQGVTDPQVLRVLNAGAVQVERTLLASFVDGEGLGLGEIDVWYLGTDRPALSAMGDACAEMAVKFRVVFLTLEGDPTKTTNED